MRTTKRIEEFRQLCMGEVKQLTESYPDIETYFKKGRSKINISLITLLIGCDFKAPRNENKMAKVSYKYPLPTKKELSTIIGILNVFIDTIEIPYLNGMGVNNNDICDDSVADEDMDIPDESEIDSSFVNCTYNVKFIDKINTKQMKSMVFGTEGEEPITTMYLNAMDVVSIAAMGEDLRKRVNRNRLLIAGGITLAIAAGIGAGIYIYNKNKKEDDINIDGIEESDDDINIEDSLDLDPVVMVDLDPEVTVDLDPLV